MRIGIVGLGLIGGSLGLDLRALGHQVIGVSQRSTTCEQAIARGAVDQARPDPRLLANVDVVFLCTPLGIMETVVQQLRPHLHPETILTDVGSVKAPIVAALSPLWSNFVGGHPMSGTAEQGINAALKGLFVGNPYVLTPTPETSIAAVDAITKLARALGSKVYYCTPEVHDRAVAWISHLPVMVSSSLIAACANEADATVLEMAQKLASSGFRDTSRVGGGNPELGVMMARYNRDALLTALYQYRDRLDQVITHIEQQNWSALEAHLQATQPQRRMFAFKPN
ncbi:prephenate/arogenate dehydrogenase [Trichothermofontia sp.]